MQLTALFAALLPLLPVRLEAFPQEKKPVQSAPAQDAQSELAAERKELAALRLLVVADRKFAEAKERLVMLEQTLHTATAVDAATLRRDVRALLDEVRRALGESVPAGSATVDEAARRALAENDFAFLAQLGPAAAPALREAVLARPDHLPSEVLADPFYYLLEADPLAASALCEELANPAGFFWKRRVLRAIGQFGVLTDARLWEPDGGATHTTRVPGLIATYEALLLDPALALQAFNQAPGLVQAGFRSAGLRAGLRAVYSSADPALRQFAWTNLRHSDLADLYEELLTSADPDLRLRAGEALVRTGTAGSTLLALVDEVDPRHRRVVCDRLAALPTERWSEREREALARLALDADAGVAGRALAAFERQAVVERVLPNGSAREVFRAPLADSVYLALAESPHSEVRSALPKAVVRKLEAPLGARVLARLAADPDPSVAVRAIDWSGQFVWEDPAGTLAVFDALLANPSLSRRDVMSRTQALEELWHLPEGRGVLAQWLLERDDEPLLREVECGNGDVAQLEPELFTRYLRRLYDVDLPRAHSLLFQPGEFGPAHLESLQRLALDAEAPIGLRHLACGAILLRPGSDHALHPVLPALFREVSKLPPTDRFQWRSLLVDMLRALPGPARNECLLALVQAPGAPAAVVDGCLTTFDAEASRAKELLLALLETRYESRDTAERNLAWRAMGYLGKPTLVDRVWLERGARDPRYRSAALNAIGQLRDPSYLPLLDELLRGGDPQAAAEVTNALTNFLSQEAGELLLVAATRLTGEARDQALTHLAKIREYQDAREEWATRKTSAATRAQVVAELVAKLDARSEEVKVQAIRALATWEAVEVMPRLIELTQSGSKNVAAAAREALERMNAMGEENKEGKVGG